VDNFTGLTTSYPSSPSSSSVCVAPVTNFRAVGSEPSDCFITCEFVTVQDILNNFHPRNTRSPPEVSSSLRVVTNLESACHLGLCTVIHSGGVPKQGLTQCLNDFSECMQDDWFSVVLHHWRQSWKWYYLIQWVSIIHSWVCRYSPSLAKIFVTRTLTRDLFAVTSLSVYSVWAY